MYKLSFLQVNKSGFSIATPVRFAYLAVSAGTVYLSLWQRRRIVEMSDCNRTWNILMDGVSDRQR